LEHLLMPVTFELAGLWRCPECRWPFNRYYYFAGLTVRVDQPPGIYP
jgi:hypothetical protein